MGTNNHAEQAGSMRRLEHALIVMHRAKALLSNGHTASITEAVGAATTEHLATMSAKRAKRFVRAVKRAVSVAVTGERKHMLSWDSPNRTLAENLLALDKAMDICRAECDRLDEMDGFRRDPEFRRFMSEGETLRKKRLDLRKGQCMLMALETVRPDIANKIKLSLVDPSASDARIPAFIEEVMQLWEDLESLQTAV